MKLNIMHVILFGAGAILIYCGVKDTTPLEMLAGTPAVKPGGGGRSFGKQGRGGGGGRDFGPRESGGGGVRPV